MSRIFLISKHFHTNFPQTFFLKRKAILVWLHKKRASKLQTWIFLFSPNLCPLEDCPLLSEHLVHIGLNQIYFSSVIIFISEANDRRHSRNSQTSVNMNSPWVSKVFLRETRKHNQRVSQRRRDLWIQEVRVYRRDAVVRYIVGYAYAMNRMCDSSHVKASTGISAQTAGEISRVAWDTHRWPRVIAILSGPS